MQKCILPGYTTLSSVKSFFYILYNLISCTSDWSCRTYCSLLNALWYIVSYLMIYKQGGPVFVVCWTLRNDSGCSVKQQRENNTEKQESSNSNHFFSLTLCVSFTIYALPWQARFSFSFFLLHLFPELWNETPLDLVIQLSCWQLNIKNISFPFQIHSMQNNAVTHNSHVLFNPVIGQSVVSNHQQKQWGGTETAGERSRRVGEKGWAAQRTELNAKDIWTKKGFTIT